MRWQIYRDELRPGGPLEDTLFPDPPHPLSRPEVRRIVTQQMEEAFEVGRRGGNPRHVMLDYRDKIHAYVAMLSTDDAINVVKLFNEETDAAGEAIEAGTQRLALDTELRKQAASHASQSGCGIVILCLASVPAVTLVAHWFG